MKFGVVIPTLDEAGAVEEALRSVAGGGSSDDAGRAPPAEEIAEEIEIVVVDGGSRDDGPERARRMGARLVELPRARSGRARQLEAGWTACGGDVVVFLHADTRLPAGWTADVGRALRDPEVVGGAFRFRFDPAELAEAGSWPLRLVEWGARLRVALFRLPYGDQAIFVRRRVLERMGGVPQAPLMEDLDLVDRMKRQGRLALLDAPATTSARRYREGGALRTFLRNAVALVAWRLGIDRRAVADWYRR